MGVTKFSNDWTVFVDLFFYRIYLFIDLFFFTYIPSTHTGTAIITTVILSSVFFFFFWNESMYYHRLYGKKKLLTASQILTTYLCSHYISSRIFCIRDSVLKCSILFIKEKSSCMRVQLFVCAMCGLLLTVIFGF